MNTESLGAVVVSVVVTLGFIGAFSLAVYLRNAGLIDTFGALLGGQFVAVVQYWVGSSSGSKKKDEQIANIGKTPPAAAST